MHGKLVLIGMMAYAGAAAGAEQALVPFRALATPIADLVRPAPYSSLYMMDPPPDMRPVLSIRSRFVDGLSHDEAVGILAAMEACAAPMKMAQIRVLGGAFSRVPVGATAFSHRDARILVAFLAMYGGGAEVVAHFDRWAADSLAQLQSGSAGNYVNFVAEAGPDAVRSAYPAAATWERLRRVKRQYDPENLFRLNHNIPPA